MVIILYNCSPGQKCAYYDTVEQECLLIPDKDDRRIIGHQNGRIFKNRLYYLVVDGEGNPAPRILECEDTIRPIDSWFISENIYDN